jgi:hypothetical protein
VENKKDINFAEEPEVTPEMAEIGGDIIQEYSGVIDVDSLAEDVYIAMYKARNAPSLFPRSLSPELLQTLPLSH